MQKVTEFNVVDHGIEHSQHFQGCGTAFTDYYGVVTGIGDNPREAFEDALENIAQMGFEVSPEVKKSMIRSWLGDRKRVVPTRPSVSSFYPQDSDIDETYYHVSIQFNVENVTPENPLPIVLPENPLPPPAKPIYELVVGNVGTVFTGTDLEEVLKGYDIYVAGSKGGLGRSAHQPVTLLCNGEILKEYVPPTEDQVMDDVNRCETDA